MFSRDAASRVRILELDGIRGFAILLVIFYHYVAVAIPEGAAAPFAFFKRLFSNGWSGVDLFFVLSGFLIAGILIDHRQAPNYFKAFYLRRLHRIFPLYYFFILLFIVGRAFSKTFAAVSPEIFVSEFSLLPYFLHLQNFLMAFNGTFGNEILAITWSLAIEEHFYLFLPLLVRKTRPDRLPVSLAIIAGFSLLLRVVLAPGTFISFVLTPWRLDGLLLGALLAVLFRRPALLERAKQQTTWIKAVVGLLALFYLVSSLTEPLGSLDHIFEFSLLFAGLIFLSLTNSQGYLARVFRNRFLRKLGRISYGIYLFHQFVNYLVHDLVFHQAPSFQSPATILVTAAAALITFLLAYATFNSFERYFISLGHRVEYSRGQSMAGS